LEITKHPFLSGSLGLQVIIYFHKVYDETEDSSSFCLNMRNNSNPVLSNKYVGNEFVALLVQTTSDHLM